MKEYIQDLSLALSAHYFVRMTSKKVAAGLTTTNLRSLDMSEEEFKRLAVNIARNNGKLFSSLVQMAQTSHELGGYANLVKVDAGSFESSFLGEGDPLNPPTRASEKIRLRNNQKAPK